jgi:serine phosphatase RsbU (regulator of sigma subunit)/putative methionine-R-sulfoxide reductase with GAF domain
VSRERLLIGYALLVGAAGWLWLLLTPQPPIPAFTLILFVALALAIDTLSFRIPPSDAYSLVGIVLLTAAIALGPAPAALVAAIEGVLSGVLLTVIYRRPRTFNQLAARPLLRGGARAAGILGGAALASAATGRPQYDPATLDPFSLLGWTIISYIGLIMLIRVGREALQGGRSGITTWWASTWKLVLSAELAPLPLALLGAAIFQTLGGFYFLLAGLALIAAAGAVRRATLNLASQRRSVRELALLNEVSRAIIRSELDVDTLCELIYREASKIVDTSSFHLGLFEGSQYTLVVRVQDRVRLPRLSVELAAGDGLIGWMRQTGKALLVEDFAEEMEQLPARPRYQSERPPRSGIYVPLIAGDAVIGSISVQSYTPSSFGANDLRLLSLIADQAAVAITRARAFREAKVRAVQLQAIQQVSERITAILNLEELLPSVVRLIREHFGYHPVHIFTIDADDPRIHFRASTAVGEQIEDGSTPPLVIGRGIVGHAAAQRTPILVGDVQRDERYIRDNRSTRSELAVPLRIGDQVVGVLDVQSDQVDDFNADDLFVMRTLADQIAIAIDSANTYMAQQEEAWTLNALLQLAENLGRATTVDTLIATAVRLPPLLIGAERCYLLLWGREDQVFLLAGAYGLRADLRSLLLGQPMRPDHAPLLERIRTAAATDGPRLLTLDHAAANVEAWPQIIAPAGSGSLAALPLIGRAGLLGALILDDDEALLPLDSRQVNLSIGAARQVAAALESLLLAREAEAAARFEEELRVAREIQTALLPAASPQLAGWQIDATWRSARLVGGDFFDFWPLPKGQAMGFGAQVPEQQRQVTELMTAVGAAGPVLLLGPERQPAAGDERLAEHSSSDASHQLPGSQALGFVIADVSDKGVPAAMFMAMSRSLVRAAALDGSPPAPAMERANRWITRDSESGMFVTLFYGLLEPETGRLRYTSAGHNPPLHYCVADGSFAELRTPGIALGVLEEIRLSEAERTLAPGDVLVCYTDGVTEAINDALEEFGVERLRGLIASHHGETATAIISAITDAVSRHGQGRPPFDDVTLLVIKREP